MHCHVQLLLNCVLETSLGGFFCWLICAMVFLTERLNLRVSWSSTSQKVTLIGRDFDYGLTIDASVQKSQYIKLSQPFKHSSARSSGSSAITVPILGTGKSPSTTVPLNDSRITGLNRRKMKGCMRFSFIFRLCSSGRPAGINLDVGAITIEYQFSE